MARVWKTKNALDFYTALWVNVLLMLDIFPRKVTEGLPGTEDINFLFVSQIYTAGSPYKVYELWTHKPERERKPGVEKKTESTYWMFI